jgi:signal transduction histidine kinase
MKRAWLVWLAYAVCAAAVRGAMGWVCLTVLRLDRAEAQARRDAAVEESVRLALWRMENALSPLIIQENARPYFAYSPFYPAARAYTRMYGRMAAAEVLIPSPLLDGPAPFVRLHFQYDSGGRIGSPQVPTGRFAVLAAERGNGGAAALESAARLEEFSRRAKASDLRPGAPDEWVLVEKSQPPAPVEKPEVLAKVEVPKKAPSPPGKKEPPPEQANLPAQSEGEVAQVQNQAAQVQQMRNVQEFSAREITGMENAMVIQKKVAPSKPKTEVAPPPDDGVWVGMLRPRWVGDALVLARPVKAGGMTYVQGCWLDWPAIRTRLLGSVKDLLPAADLVPQRDGDNPAEGRTLAALPLRLVPGPLPAAPLPPEVVPLRLTLALAGAGVLLAVAAVGLLLLGAQTLSQRRAAFVSSVTHELRTPLTTFRLYTEMLAEEMAPDPAQQRQYHRVLQQEADRLSHLVENVLAYARLERGRYGVRERVALEELLGRLVPRLSEHAARSGMELVREPASSQEEPLGGATTRADAEILADTAAVERILFNLVDNAGRYAKGAADRRVHLEVTVAGREVCLAVADHGPGIDRGQLRQLFKPFRKSAREAARTAPGVGLGLMLSRRLARAMGGRLRLASTSHTGTRFELSLPLADS